MIKDDKRKRVEKTEGKKFTKFKNKPSVADIILTLEAESFFNKPKTLAEIKAMLEQQGHFYPITTLSGVVLSLVKKKTLRRLRQDKDRKWVYVKH